MLTSARSRLTRVTPREAFCEMALGATLVDIRPAAQRAASGEVPGSWIVERNHLEWRFDPACGARLPWVSGYDHRVIVICAEGYTSSLAAAALQDLGLHRATDVDGGFAAWAQLGLPTAPAANGTAAIAPGASAAAVLARGDALPPGMGGLPPPIPPGPRNPRCAPGGKTRHLIGARSGLGAVVELGEAVPGEIDKVGGDLFQLGLAGIEPPLAGERHHADQHL